MDATLMSRWVKKFRILTLALIFSGALNIGLIAACIFSFLSDRQESLSVAIPSKGEGNRETTVQQIFSQMAKQSFHELVTYLTNRDPVEEGYLKRDLAVAALASFHHFNLEKALSGIPSQRRVIALGDEQKVEIFPGLRDDQFEAIIRFAYEEKWPLTSEGVFKLLKKMPDASLIQAFLVTPEFHALNVLFQKTEAAQEPAVLLRLAAEGNWDILDRFAREQAQLLDLSVEKRRRLLLSYLASGSPTAAQLLVSTDFAFAAKRLEDRGIVDLLGLLKEKTPDAERLCIELLRAPRTDVVWQASAQRLYSYAGESVPEPFDLKAAIARFAPGPVAAPEPVAAAPVKAPAAPVKAVAAVPAKPAKSAARHHVVQDGESLWKIARHYKVKVEEIVKANELEKDRLYPGMTLLIPQGSGQ